MTMSTIMSTTWNMPAARFSTLGWLVICFLLRAQQTPGPTTRRATSTRSLARPTSTATHAVSAELLVRTEAFHANCLH